MRGSVLPCAAPRNQETARAFDLAGRDTLMELTVREILNMDLFAGATVFTRSDDLLDRQVTGVSVIEMPVEDFVNRGDLVLTTGLGCGHDERELRRFVDEILELKPAAVAIATGKFVQDIPRDISSRAEAQLVPLLGLPWDVRFGDIIREVMFRLAHEEVTDLQRSEELYNRLMGMILNGGGFDDICRALYGILRQPVGIQDGLGKIRAVFPPGLTSLADPKCAASFPIRGAKKVLGTLLVESTKGISDIGMRSVLHGTTAAAVLFLQEQALGEAEARLRGNLVWMLAKGSSEPEEVLLHRASTLGYDLTRAYQVIVGVREGIAPRTDLWRPVASTKTYRPRAEDLVRHVMNQNGRQAIVSCSHAGIILLVEVEDAEGHSIERRFLEEIAEKVGQALAPDYGRLVFGIGRFHPGIEGLRRGYEEAEIAIDIGRRVDSRRRCFFFSDMGVYRILCKMTTDAEITTLCVEYLGKLLEYDRRYGRGLLNTLETFLRCGSNITQTSRRLHLHRQSLLYRLKKIEELTGCNLKDPEDRFTLEVITRLHQFRVTAGSRLT